jgi:hypothetical protein
VVRDGSTNGEKCGSNITRFALMATVHDE